jgi:hypothetical protein
MKIDGGQQVRFSVAFLICSLGIHVTLLSVSLGLSPDFYCVIPLTNSMSPSASLLPSQLPFSAGSGLDHHPTAVPGGVSL